MHPRNLHNVPYDLQKLTMANPALAPFVFTNRYGTRTVDFSLADAVLQLNRALLMCHYGLQDWNIPEGYLCPPIPSRADYIHYLADLIGTTAIEGPISGLDIGVGANAIYPILGAQIYQWNMVGTDIDDSAVAAAQENIRMTKGLSDKVRIRQQLDPANIFGGVLLADEYYHFTMCNPPFHPSREAATKGTLRKVGNLHGATVPELNFGGNANELWCNGGEALFIKRMIKQSQVFGKQVGWFTTLVSKKENLPKIYAQLKKLKATYNSITMEIGHKKTRFVAWKFM